VAGTNPHLEGNDGPVSSELTATGLRGATNVIGHEGSLWAVRRWGGQVPSEGPPTGDVRHDGWLLSHRSPAAGPRRFSRQLGS
jgi:hypothetical protein